MGLERVSATIKVQVHLLSVKLISIRREACGREALLVSRFRAIIFFSGYLGPFHTTQDEFENGALSTVHSYPSQNGAFRKRTSNQRNLKTTALRFSVQERSSSNTKT